MLLRRFALAITVAVTVGLGTVAAPAGALPLRNAANATAGFVTRTGTALSVNGQPWAFAGYNLPCANPFDLSDASLGYYLDNIKLNSGANALRVWFFQSQGGPGNWKNFDRVIAALDARGMRAVVTLTNETSTCDEPSATTFNKTIAWYQSGYRSPEGGYKLSFRQYAADVAKHFTKDPGIALWQLVNEAEAPSQDANGNLTCDEAAAAEALRSFSDDMVSAIKQVDDNHLVNLGTIGSGQCGTSDSHDYTFVHAGLLDVCEFHDYGFPSAAMPSELAQRISDCHSIGKPLFIGESGIPADVQPDGTPAGACDPWPSCAPYPVTTTTLNQRGQFFAAKINAAAQAGVAGYLIWVKSPYYSATNNGYAIGDGDPTEATLMDFPQSPPPVLPESSSPLALIGSGTAAIIAVGAVARHRRRTAPAES